MKWSQERKGRQQVYSTYEVGEKLNIANKNVVLAEHRGFRKFKANWAWMNVLVRLGLSKEDATLFIKGMPHDSFRRAKLHKLLDPLIEPRDRLSNDLILDSPHCSLYAYRLELSRQRPYRKIIGA
jgi:hypothetical protein